MRGLQGQGCFSWSILRTAIGGTCHAGDLAFALFFSVCFSIRRKIILLEIAHLLSVIQDKATKKSIQIFLPSLLITVHLKTTVRSESRFLFAFKHFPEILGVVK